MGRKTKIFYGILALLFISITILFVSPAQFLKANGSSMKPTINDGDAIIVIPTSEKDIKIGDVISYNRGGWIITHRVIDKENGKIITKGDNLSNKDPYLVDPSEVIGKHLLTIPYLGQILVYLSSPIGFILLVLIPGGLLVFNEARKLQKNYRINR